MLLPLLFAAIAPAALALPAPPLFTLGAERLQPYPSPAPYQFPDAAISVLDDGAGGGRLMFWSDGTTYRVVGPGLFPANTPSPLTPVLGKGPTNKSYDWNGNWMLGAFRVEGEPTALVGFTHVENHVFDCPGPYSEWNAAAVVSSQDDGVTWAREGLAIHDPQPCAPTFGGAGYSSVIRHNGAFLGFGGCTGFRSLDPRGAPGTWARWKDGAFSSPGVNGSSDCLPGLPANACCPIVHYNSFLGQFVAVYNTWGRASELFVAASEDGVNWGPSALLLQVEANRSLGYGQVIGDHNSSVAGRAATLAYAAAPPTGDKPRDFVYRSITFAPAAAPAAAAPSKRGLSMPHAAADAALYCADLAAAVAAGTVSWTYDWAQAPPDAGCSALDSLRFEPMIWGANSAQNTSALFANARTTHLLLFNEPNGKDQSNLTPAQAAALWPSVAAAARARNLSLVAPVPSGTDTVWLRSFFAACQCEAEVAAVALHPYSCAPAALRSALDAWAAFGKPLWVSEFNCGDGMKNASAAEHMAWMQAALPILEGDARVARYAWMSARNEKVPGSALFAGAGGELTALGRFYLSYAAA